MKALPEDPDMVTRAVEATLSPQGKKRARSHKEEERTPSLRQKEKTPSLRFEEKTPAHRYEEPRQTPTAPVARKPESGSSSPKPKPKTRTRKAPPAPIKTSEKLGNFMRSGSASVSALSPKLLSPRFRKESDSKSVGERSSDGKSESKPQSTLKRARSKLLKRKSIGPLGDASKTEQQEHQNQPNQPTIAELSGISSGGADSAYSSGTDAERRPNTSPDPIPSLRPPANFALFPSTPPSLAPSINSLRSISSNHDTDKESVIMALPPMPHKPVMEPSPLRRGSIAGPGLKKKGSLASLLGFFKRQKSEKPVAPPVKLSDTDPVYELA